MSRRKRNKLKNFVCGNAASIPRGPSSILAGRRFTRTEAFPPTVIISKPEKPTDIAIKPLDDQTKKILHSILGLLFVGVIFTVLSENRDDTVNPPKNAELLLLLIVRGDERDAVIGDLIERYRSSHERLGRRRADLYAYGEVCRSLFPFIKRFLLGTGLIALLGQWIRKLIS